MDPSSACLVPSFDCHKAAQNLLSRQGGETSPPGLSCALRSQDTLTMNSGSTSTSASSSPRVKAEEDDGRFVSHDGHVESFSALGSKSGSFEDLFTSQGHALLSDGQPGTQHQSNPNAEMHIVGEGDGEDGDDHTAKKPRLRLAHACDRCRRRKIRVNLKELVCVLWGLSLNHTVTQTVRYTAAVWPVQADWQHLYLRDT